MGSKVPRCNNLEQVQIESNSSLSQRGELATLPPYIFLRALSVKIAEEHRDPISPGKTTVFLPKGRFQTCFLSIYL